MKREGRPCNGTVRDVDGDKRSCPNDGVPVYVIGSFGRAPQNLCKSCIQRARELGWKVEYQLSAGVKDVDTTEGRG